MLSCDSSYIISGVGVRGYILHGHVFLMEASYYCLLMHSLGFVHCDQKIIEIVLK